MALLYDSVGETETGAAENALIRAFEEQGYQVYDRNAVRGIIAQEKGLIDLYDIEAAKHLGLRLGVDVVVSGSVKAKERERTFDTLGGRTMVIHELQLGGKVILARTGEVLAAESDGAKSASALKASDEAAAKLSAKLIAEIERYRQRTTNDYRVVLFDVDGDQASAFRRALGKDVPGVVGVVDKGFVEGAQTLDVSVKKPRDVEFKRRIFSDQSAIGEVRYEVIAREGKAIYLRNRALPSGLSGTPSVSARPPVGSSDVKLRGYRAGYSKSRAVVIGINDYQHWPKLSYAVSDATAIERLLRQRGFDDVTLLLDGDATRENILRALGEDLAARARENDQVVIFFAGHGQTEDTRNGEEIGYLIPSDGRMGDYYSTAVSMRTLREYSEQIRAKHIFYVMDSCFSGMLLRFRGTRIVARDTAENEKKAAAPMETTLKARQVLTAGSEGELVAETGGHGLFTGALLKGLEGAADANSDGLVFASELAQYVSVEMAEKAENVQNPVFGRLTMEQGDFVFLPRNQ